MEDQEHGSIYAQANALLRLLGVLGLEPTPCEGIDGEPCLSQPMMDSGGVVLDRWGRRHEECPGPLPAEKLADTETNREAMSRRIVSIMKHYGGDPAQCRSCGQGIIWVITRNGKKAPYQPDGRSHFAGCPAAQEHRRRRGDE